MVLPTPVAIGARGQPAAGLKPRDEREEIGETGGQY